MYSNYYSKQFKTLLNSSLNCCLFKHYRYYKYNYIIIKDMVLNGIRIAP